VRLTRAGEYAVRCILHLSGQPEGSVVKRREVAQAMNIPEPFLGKIGQQLARAGIVELVQGARGGLRMARAPREVSLLDVVEAVNGPIFLNDCLMRRSICQRSPGCAAHRVWDRARSRLRETLGEATFAELLKAESESGPPAPHPIGGKSDPRPGPRRTLRPKGG
jgi:Rrf2 family transcriptional regulator, iron-sulfur cluster assembly transcription factor